MTPIGSFLEFEARLRRFIRASVAPGPGDPPPRPESLDAEFNTLALELFGLQFEHNAPYRSLSRARNLSPQDVADWSDIPAVPAAAFKELDLSCLPPEARTAVFHSSGTTGQQRSRHYHNDRSLALYEASLLPWFEANVLDCGRGTGDWQLTVLAPPPAQAPDSSLVHMFETVRRRLGAPASAFVGRAAADGDWVLDLEPAVAALRTSLETARPALLLGTAFMFVRLVDSLAEAGLELELPPGSRAMETGGYKGRSRAMLPGELHALVARRLRVAPARIVREYGMSELSSQAYAGPPGSSRPFHFPLWARARLISPESGEEVPEGGTGLIWILDLANAYSVLAVQTEDLGFRRGDGFELLGRAALAEPRGCSLMAV